MRALTICQPWAWAISHGPKRFENRTWSTEYRGSLLIHAGKSKKWLGPGICELQEDFNTDPPADLVYSAIVAIADLVSCLPPDAAVYHNPHLDGRFASGPICWTVHNVRPLTPIPCAGLMGLWTPSSEIVDAVNDQLRTRFK
jgi:hypothetical protein